MDVRIGAELGLKEVNRGAFKKFKPINKENNIPGKPLINKRYEMVTKQTTAVKVNQARDYYQVTGSTVNFQA